MHRLEQPQKSAGINGDHEAIWAMLMHLSSRIDRLYVAIGGGLLVLFGLAASILGIVISRGV